MYASQEPGQPEHVTVEHGGHIECRLMIRSLSSRSGLLIGTTAKGFRGHFDVFTVSVIFPRRSTRSVFALHNPHVTSRPKAMPPSAPLHEGQVPAVQSANRVRAFGGDPKQGGTAAPASPVLAPPPEAPVLSCLPSRGYPRGVEPSAPLASLLAPKAPQLNTAKPAPRVGF